MSPVVKSVLSLVVLCAAALLGTCSVHSARETRHLYRLRYAAAHGRSEVVIAEYRRIPQKLRDEPEVQAAYEEALQKGGKDLDNDFVFPVFPTTTEGADLSALAVFAIGMTVLCVWLPSRRHGVRTSREDVAQSELPSEGQLSIIRRINNGVVPLNLTRSAASAMIWRHFARVSEMQRRRRIDVCPLEFLSSSRSNREKMKIERERKRAQEAMAREMEREERRREREEQRARKAQDHLFDKRIAEEEKLIQARKDAESGVVRKSRSAKMQTVQEFQGLVNDILADKIIEPQEVRQLKAWLMAHMQKPDDFAAMFKVIDESLVDGIIDTDETQAIYEGIIDCLITLRERR